MKLKGLALIALGALTIYNTGCSVDHSEYKFSGKIGEDYVEFKEEGYSIFPDNNILTEVKPDGRIIRYVDKWWENLKLDYIDITKNGKKESYTTDDKVVLKDAQKKFDNRMKQILEINTNKAERLDKLEKDYERQAEDDRIKWGLDNLK